MTASSPELDRKVLETVSEDYQSFETVVSKLSRVNAVPLAVGDIERLLLGLIADNFVTAYLIHADPPYATEVGAGAETIRRYWFCVTERGRQYLGRLVRAQADVPRSKSL